ncbi:MAG: hypothetical protein R6X16_17260 [Anaerolineae bacterium]
MLKRWRYRIWQGLTRLRADLRPHAIDLEPARRQLSGEAWGLFGALSSGDQEHAIGVFRLIQQQSGGSDALADAALLHDVGKLGAGLNLGWRALIVILGALGLVERAASRDPNSWRHPLYLHLHHAERGAEMCANAGCSPEVVALVRWHDATPGSIPDETIRIDLAILRAADDAC